MPSKLPDFIRERHKSLTPSQRREFNELTHLLNIGLWLYSRRTALGLTQAELAKKSGIQQSDISRYEHSEISPSLETLMKLLGALDASLILKANQRKRKSPVKNG